MKHQIRITAEYLPSTLNAEADWQSWNSRDPSEWKLCPKVFQYVCQRRGMPKIDLLASRLSHNYPSTLLGNSTLSVRGQMPYSRFGAISFFMHFLHFALFYKFWRKWVTAKQKPVAFHTHLAVSNLVSLSTRNVYSLSTAASKDHKLNKPTTGSSPSNWKQNITTSGVDHIRERLLKRGVSETAAQLITSTRRKS